MRVFIVSEVLIWPPFPPHLWKFTASTFPWLVSELSTFMPLDASLSLGITSPLAMPTAPTIMAGHTFNSVTGDDPCFRGRRMRGSAWVDQQENPGTHATRLLSYSHTLCL